MENNKIEKKLKGKDLITIGIFSSIYFVLALICNILGGFHAIIWFFSPSFAAIICSIPYMIMISKVKKSLAVIIMGIVVGFLFFITGQFHIIMPITFIICSIIADIIRYVTKYSSFIANGIGFSIFSLGMAASPLPLWLDSESFIRQIKEFGMPQSYIDTVISLTSPIMLLVMTLSTIICGLIGALIAKFFLNKHFKKAGVVA